LRSSAPDTVSDATLVGRARAGDRRAFESLYDRHAAYVARILTRILGPDPDVPDVLHDVFVQALARLADLDDPTAFRAWAASIGIYKARGTIRKRVRWRWLRVLSGEDPISEPVAEPPSGEDAEAVRAVYLILARLSADERVAFTLRRLDGMSLGEVASLTGVSLATVKRRLARAEARFRAEAREHEILRDWLAGEGDDEGETR